MSGLKDSHIKKLNHFSVLCEKEAFKLTGIKHKGLVFSYFNPVTKQPYLRGDGKPFYRVKPRDWGDRDDVPKYLSPAQEGNRPYWSNLIEDFEKKANKISIPLEIVEGEKKADCLAAEGFFVLGLSGVASWLDKTPRTEEIENKPAQLIEDDEVEQDIKAKRLEQGRLLPEIKETIQWKGRRINITFDSDLWEKPNVRFMAQSLALELSSLGASPYFIRLPNEADGSKNGVDDFKVRHGINAYRQLCRVASRKLKWFDPEDIEKVTMTVAVLKESWRYRPGTGWMNWNGKAWESRVDCEFECSLIDFQDSQGWRRIKGMDTQIRQLKGRLLVPEREWNQASKLVFENGTLDLRSSEFIEGFQRESFNTSVLPYGYDPSASFSNWLRFLEQALEQDTRAIELLQAFIKWVLVPKPKDKKAQIEKCLDIIGPKGTGKGTFLDVLIGLVGSDNVGAIGQSTFKDANCLADLSDKKLSIDTDAFGYLANVGLFNKVVSNEPVPIRRLYKDYITGRLGTVIVRAYNRVLEVPDGAEGLDRRIIALHFNHKPKEVDLNLSDKLRQELPGIFQWAWNLPLSEAKRRLMAAGEVEAVRDASVKRFEANNPEFCFLREVFPEGNKVKVSDLYASYSDWCKETGVSQKKRRKFMEALQQFGVNSTRSTGGFYWADIPNMNDFDTISFLGVSRKTQASEVSELTSSELTSSEPQKQESSPPQTQMEQEVQTTSEESEVSRPRTFSKRTFEPEKSIGLGDWVKYKRSAPDSSVKVSCGSKLLQILNFRETPEGVEAECKAEKWIYTEWIKLKFLQFAEAGKLELLEDFEQEEEESEPSPEDIAVEKQTITLRGNGEFYDAFDRDAEVLSEQQGFIVSESKGKKMTGIPCQSLEKYQAELEAKGFTLKIEEHVEPQAPILKVGNYVQHSNDEPSPEDIAAEQYDMKIGSRVCTNKGKYYTGVIWSVLDGSLFNLKEIQVWVKLDGKPEQKRFDISSLTRCEYKIEEHVEPQAPILKVGNYVRHSDRKAFKDAIFQVTATTGESIECLAPNGKIITASPEQLTKVNWHKGRSEFKQQKSLF